MLSLSILVPTVAQTEISYGVKWIAVYPDNEEDKKMNFGDRVSRIVLGKKEQDVIKPFSIQAIDPLHFWILDQGAGLQGMSQRSAGIPVDALSRRRCMRKLP